MKRTAIFLLLWAALNGAAPLLAGDLVPGAIYVHTARDGTTLATSDKSAPSSPLKPGTIFEAKGQILFAPTGLTAALVLSNGNALYLPNGGRLTLEEFTQEAVVNTAHERDYEPTRSNLHLNLAEGTLVITGRKAVPTSTFTISTPLAEIQCHAQSFVVRVDAEGLTITVFDGIAEITAEGTQLHDTVQAGQTATLSRHSLHDAYPLKLAVTSTDSREHLGVFLDSARRIESNTTFNGTRQHFQVTLRISVDHTLQISAEDPRFL